MSKILVLYYSENNHTLNLAEEVADGVYSVAGSEPVIRTLPKVTYVTEESSSGKSAKVPFAQISDLAECDGLVLGSPTHFGNMASPMQLFFEQAVGLWLNGNLIDKPFGVFTSTASLHGGQESTLLSMALPCLHMGMLYVGVPYSVKALSGTSRGGTPYGASQWSEGESQAYPSKDEASIAFSLGARVAKISDKLPK